MTPSTSAHDPSCPLPSGINLFRRDGKPRTRFTASERLAVLGGHEHELEVYCRLFAPRRYPYLSYSSYIAGVGVPSPKGITIWFETFLTEKTKFGTVYLSPLRPTITIDGQKGEVAYSTHALGRRLQRTGNISSNSYKARVFSFQAAYHLDSVQPWHDEEGKPGFVFAERVSNPLANALIEQVVGEPGSDRECLLRSGYCPAVFDNGRWVAKSVLLPGMRGTPEHKYFLSRRDLSAEQKQEISRSISQLDLMHRVGEPDFTLLRFFQQSGIAQVIALG